MDRYQGSISGLVRAIPPVGVYRFTFCAEQPVLLPAYSGSAWRGLIGHGLRRTVCVTRQPTCDGCLLTGACAYSLIFERPANAVGYGAQSPLPYVLVPELLRPPTVEQGEDFHLEIRLLGNANQNLPYLVHAMRVAGERGIGKAGGRFALRSVDQRSAPDGHWQRIFDADGSLQPLPPFAATDILTGATPAGAEVELVTPLRIKHRGRLAGPREFDGALWLRHVLWRLQALASRFGPRGGEDAVWQAAHDRVAGLRTTGAKLRWHDWTRYSSRQDTRMQMGGLVGVFRIDGENLPGLWPLLEVGEWTLVGKTTTMGLGRYALRDAASLPNPLAEAPAVTIRTVGGAR